MSLYACTNQYYGIIIVHGVPMFLAFEGNPCPWMYIPPNIYTIICLIFIKIISITQKNYVPTKVFP